MKILFICKHNRFRSKVAEALFKKYAGLFHQAKSAAVEIDLTFPYVADSVKEVLSSYGVRQVADAPVKVSENLVKWADKIIIVANNVDAGLFPAHKTEVWSITDCDQNDVKSIRRRVAEINEHVLILLRSLSEKRP